MNTSGLPGVLAHEEWLLLDPPKLESRPLEVRLPSCRPRRFGTKRPRHTRQRPPFPPSLNSVRHGICARGWHMLNNNLTCAPATHRASWLSAPLRNPPERPCHGGQATTS